MRRFVRTRWTLGLCVLSVVGLPFVLAGCASHAPSGVSPAALTSTPFSGRALPVVPTRSSPHGQVGQPASHSANITTGTPSGGSRPGCNAAALSVDSVTSEPHGSSSPVHIVMTLTYTGTTACTVDGYPVARLLDANDRVIQEGVDPIALGIPKLVVRPGVTIRTGAVWGSSCGARGTPVTLQLNLQGSPAPGATPVTVANKNVLPPPCRKGEEKALGPRVGGIPPRLVES